LVKKTANPAHFQIAGQQTTVRESRMETPHWATASSSLDSLVFSTMSLESGGQQRGARGLPSRVERCEEPQVEVSSVSLDLKASKTTMTLLDRMSRWWRPVKGTSGSSRSPSSEPEHLRLSNESGMLQPGTLTLVLGRPGSGKSALLQALAGRLDSTRTIRGEEIRYNGLPQPHLLDKVLPHSVVYVAQQDDHHASLTVRETLEFACRCCRSTDSSPSPRRSPSDQHTPADIEHGEADNKLDELTENHLGLAHCADSFVGDELRRGVSGGERKRVTVGEMLVSTGLDSATAMDVVITLRRMARDKRLTVVMALLQPAPNS
jgi:ABC-type cobalamin/Fe3+-siderophores transport system ATPase subunit